VEECYLQLGRLITAGIGAWQTEGLKGERMKKGGEKWKRERPKVGEYSFEKSKPKKMVRARGAGR